MEAINITGKTGECVVPTASHIKLHWAEREILVEDMSENATVLRILMYDPPKSEARTPASRAGISWADLLEVKRQLGIEEAEGIVRQHFPKGADMLIKMLLEDDG